MVDGMAIIEFPDQEAARRWYDSRPDGTPSATAPLTGPGRPASTFSTSTSSSAATTLATTDRPSVTLQTPDQYALSAFQRLELAPGHKPVMAEIDLTSSHWPWAPLPTMVPWNKVGDGSRHRPHAR